MRTTRRLLLLAILASLLAGQLARINLTPQIAFYPHDVLIIIYLLFSLPSFLSAVRHFTYHHNYTLYHKYIILSSLIGLIGLGSWLVNRSFTLPAGLYTARYLTYLLFAYDLSTQNQFTKREFSTILSIFFISLASLGLGQYLLWPDTRALEWLGWDDHYYRLIGPWFDPAFTGLALSWGLMFWLTKKRDIKTPIIWYIIAILFTFCILLTFSRSSFLGLVVAGLIAGWSARRRSRPDSALPVGFGRPSWLVWASGGVAGLGLIVAIFYSLSLKNPSDSTNLLRTNSITIRLAMLTAQLDSLTPGQWLIGRGPFVALPGGAPAGAGAKVTAAFPDNLAVLLISFVGLPAAGLIMAELLCRLWRLYTDQSVLFYYLLTWLVSAAFNQSFFQPLLVVLAGLVWAGCRKSDPVA